MIYTVLLMIEKKFIYILSKIQKIIVNKFFVNLSLHIYFPNISLRRITAIDREFN
jgi:hypothetical protein